MARFCRFSKTCFSKGCQGKHHSLLHQSSRLPKKLESRPTTSQPTVGLPKAQSVGAMIESREHAFLNIVPVTVFSGNPQISCYAFLNQGSTMTLC